MIAKRVMVVLALVAVLHNCLRFAVWALKGPPEIFGYLRPFHPIWTTPAIVQVTTVALGFLFCLGVASRFWMGPRQVSSRLAAALWASLAGLVCGLMAVAVSTSAIQPYGFALFVLTPVVSGFVAGFVLRSEAPVSRGQAALAGVAGVSLLGLLLLAIDIEGALCVVMAAPIAIGLAALGGVAGHAAVNVGGADQPLVFLLALSLSPLGGAIEGSLNLVAPIFQVTTAIEIAATPERVWNTILQPSKLAPPSSLTFRAGVAYPRASHIEGAGLSAIRYCDFSTGKLVEPILVWDDRRELRFRVASNPQPMQEWTPYAQIHPRHLDGFLISKQGQFRLEPLPGGRCRLYATTWYQHHLWPAQYWRWWSDHIIHEVHAMVLADIDQRARSYRESAATPGN